MSINLEILFWDKKVIRQNWQTIRPIYYFVIETSGVFDCNANVTYFVHSPALKISAYQQIQCAYSFARWRYSDLAVLAPTLIGTVITGYTTGYTGYYDRYLLNKIMQCAVVASFQKFRRKWEVVISTFCQCQ